MLLRDARLATLDPPHVESADLRVENGRIGERGHLEPRLGEDVWELGGRLVLPGLVNAHTHLYSALARGMPAPARAPRSFVEILERVWWRLDRALDEESVRLSAMVGAIEAARSGTTLLVDHHASPSFLQGSLAVVREAVESVGLRSALCYEVTDRNGLEQRDLGVAENLALARSLVQAPSPLTRALVGAHASFTLSDESLERMADAVAKTGSCLHVHVAEDLADVEDCRRRSGQGLGERFARHGLLTTRGVVAHAVHLSEPELEALQERGVWIVHNPRSNMSNAVGYGRTRALRRAALGTDGMDEDLWAEARACFLRMREDERPDALGATLDLLRGGHRLGAALFGLPFGSLGAGAPADLVVFDYLPPTPLTAENLGGHLLFGVDRSHVASVIVAGRVVLRDRRIAGVDTDAVFAQARDAAAALWARMRALD
jgi:putative selenium metabolism protein SsnA